MELEMSPERSSSEKGRAIVVKSEIVFEESTAARREETGRKPAFAFVNATGPIAKNAGVQRSIRKHVMRDIGKSRRKNAKSRSPESKPKPSPSNPPISIVVEASPEFWNSVQLVRRTKDFPKCVYPTCGAPGYARATSYNDSMSSEEKSGPMYCQDHHLLVENIQNEAAPRISHFSGGRIDPFLRYPIEMSPEVRRLLDHTFDDRKRNIKFYRDRIFPIGLLGPASFHQALSNLALYLRRARRLEEADEYEAREEIAHQAQAYSLVNRKIAAHEATSEDVIGAVAAMACHSHVVEDTKAFKMHMAGLSEMIRLRGGVETLESLALRTSLYWLDTNGGCTDDTLPQFPFPPDIPFRPDLPQEIKLPKATQRITNTWRTRFPDQTEIIDILEDVSRVSLHVESEELRTAGHVYTDVVFASTLINSLVYRLLELQPRSIAEIDTPYGALKEATRLGLYLFLAEVRRRFGLHPVNTATHVEKLRGILMRDGTDWNGLEDLRVWIVAMGVLEAVDEQSVRWMVDDWTRTTIAEEMTIPSNMERTMSTIMWMDSVHGKRYRRLHDRFWGRGIVLAPRPKVIIQIFQEGEFKEDGNDE